MQPMLTEHMVSTRVPRGNLHLQSARQATPASLLMDRDELFLGLLAGFRRSGGLIRAHDVGGWLEGGAGHKAGTLGRWMAHNGVIHFDWQFWTWLPMFQFDTAAMAPRVAVGLALIELDGLFDNWGMAQWFASPNATLEGRNPAAAMSADPGLVIEAARREKYLVNT